MATEGRYEGDDPTRVVARPARPSGPDMGPGGPMYGEMPPGRGMYGYGPPWGYQRPWQRGPIETKPFFLTSEFFGAVIVIVAMAIGASSAEDFDSRLFWILTTAIVCAYMLSRGIAKSGTKSRSVDPREQLFQGEGQGRRND